jgi:hypothetical protein
MTGLERERQVMLRSQDCRDKALECYRMARRSGNDQSREILKQMARYWRSLSQQAATIEQLAKGHPFGSIGLGR